MSASPLDATSLDATAMVELVRGGQVTAAELGDAARARHRATHATVNAVVEWYDDPDGPDQAAQSVGERSEARLLAGVPFLRKDYGSAEAGRLVEMGSRLGQGFRATETSEYYRVLEAHGVQVLGRTAVPEFIQHGTTESRVHGPTRNPLDPSLSAGGSSGGAAAAVAAGVVPIAHASDCAGSIRIPASVCGLYGLKPGRRSIPGPASDPGGWGGIAEEFVVSRTLRDTELLWDVLGPTGLGSSKQEVASPTKPSIAVSLDHWAGASPDPEVVAAAMAVAEAFEHLGHRVETIEQPVDYEQLVSTWHPLFSRWIARDVRLLEDATGRVAGPDNLEPLTLALLDEVSRLTVADLDQAQVRQGAIARRVERALHPFDVLLTPTLGRPTIPLGALGGEVESMDSYLRLNDETFPYNYLFNVTGWASLTLPSPSASPGRPIGVQLSAPWGYERTLLRLANQLL